MILSQVVGFLVLVSWGAVEVDWDTATLRLSDFGAVVALRDNTTGCDYAVGDQPFCRIETREGQLVPTAVTRSGDQVSFAFPGGASMTYRVTGGAGFSLWELESLDGLEPEKVRSLDLCTLNLDGLSTVGSQLNAGYDDSFAAAVMARYINVHAFPTVAGAQGGNLDGVTHTLLPERERVQEGRTAARFIATSSRDKDDGWSVRGRAFRAPLDLTGLQAVKAWVHGDGKGELLKIQLFDGKGGYRDDYIRVDFTGWREVVCDQPALNTVDCGHIARLNLYYNGLPSNTSVECTIDAVRAVIKIEQGVREVMLENFEDSAGELWDARGVFLQARSYERHGVTPAGFGIIACPRERFKSTIDAFEKAAGLPNPHPGGVWSKASPWTEQSYLFITRFGEKDTDEVIAWANRGGFDTILILGDSWGRSHGHHEINRDMFPDGLPSLQRTAERMRQAGFRVGLHFLAAAVYLGDPYVCPTPDPRLFKDAWAELASDVSEDAEFIPTVSSPDSFPVEDGGYLGKGEFIQIGDELIHYGELRTEPPCGFARCERGAAQTRASAHGKGDRIAHLLRSYGYFLYDLDSTLADEVIGNVCQAANAINADMLYFDGSERLQGEHWYYNGKLHKMYHDRLTNKDTFLQGSSYSHFSWHINSRMASADGHGDLKGYLDQRIPSFAHREADLMPLDIGWYYVYDPGVTADQFEYVLQKCLGFGASISVQTSPQHLREHPEMEPIIDLVRIYDRLRMSGEVSESLRELLREPGREYRLLTSPLRLRRIVYEPWQEVRALDGKQNVFTVQPGMKEARLGVQIRCGPALSDTGQRTVTEVAGLVNPEIEIGDRRVVFPVTLNEGERLVWFPGERPEVIPARQGPRHRLAGVSDITLTDAATVTFRSGGPLTAVARVRLVRDLNEEHPLPTADGLERGLHERGR